MSDVLNARQSTSTPEVTFQKKENNDRTGSESREMLQDEFN
jgi:hypothetical protein